MSITITKTGDKPAEITVKEGDEKWEVSEKDLDKLPEKVRPYVDGMLGLAASTGSGAVALDPGGYAAARIWTAEYAARGAGKADRKTPG